VNQNCVVIQRQSLKEELAILSCSKDPKKINSKKHNRKIKEQSLSESKEPCVQMKILIENGTIMEHVCLEVYCIRKGVTCYPFQNEILSLDITCSTELTDPEFHSLEESMKLV